MGSGMWQAVSGRETGSERGRRYIVKTDTGRLHHLDALRAFAMIYGIFLHTTTLGDFGVLEVLPVLSDHFRMASFFLVSAMLSAAVLGKRSPGAFVRRRLLTILVPLGTALILLNPVTLALVALYHNPEVGFSIPAAVVASFEDPSLLQGPLIWHLHLWFLFSLAAYALVLPPAAALARLRQDELERLAGRLPAWSRLPALGLLVMALGLTIRVAAELLIPGLHDIWLVSATLRYLPYVLAGVLVFLVPSLRSAMERTNWTVLGMGALAIAAEIVLGSRDSTAAKLILFGFKYLSTFAMVHLLMILFARWASKPSRAVMLIIRSIFTVYLVHYLLIYAFALAIRPLGLSDWGIFLVVSVLTLGTGLAFHFGLVARVGVLRFLLNGDLRRTPSPVAPAAMVGTAGDGRSP